MKSQRTCTRLLSTSSALRHAQPVSVSTKARVQAKIAQVDSEKSFSPSLVDSYSRKHDYLRISLTERCNLRCFYCMPSEGVELSPQGKIITNDEVIRLAKLFVQSGVTKIRLTGGEPTVRKGIGEIIARLNELRGLGLKSIAMTTNGIALHRRLPEFIDNGLSHLNLSLDTLDPFKFEIMTRRPGHDLVLRTLDVALASSKLDSLKLNVVIVKGLNDAEALDFVELTKDKPISVRFIEFMPFTGNKWDKAKMLPSSELLSRISKAHPTLARAPDELNDTARSWKIPGYAGTIGFISSMSDHFCASCNRLRITADGQIKVCLFDAKELSLRDSMRIGASDSDLLEIIGRAVQGKQEKHAGMENIDVITNRPMILIGGPSLWRLYSSSAEHQPQLSHIDSAGRPSMVNVADKTPTKRSATATGRIYIPRVAYDLIVSSVTDDVDGTSAEAQAKTKARGKGDVLTIAQLAAIMGAKRTSELIPLCHPLALSHISVTLTHDIHQSSTNNDNEHTRYSILCSATVTCEGKTGVEMEALTAVSVGALTVWDMLKAVAGKEMVIGDIMVVRKEGGKSGDFVRENMGSSS
ncbi:hypothetical protein PILCRDRAFT_62019 [Piloderma croceum F 1598]|uniref:Radical SAM core domain-containing protein n=1 Tax=Piloderma croceum (strain F 1598) TaxID=765440 RepID=A0A0C3CGF4_PILCF|nr:hypothetical protein PILCRDRAFT_62019 [Piloderma croceum F 1598]